MRVVVSIVLVAFMLAGCHTMRFDLEDTTDSNVVYDRKSFFLWSLAPTRKVDVSQFCPAGVAAIKEETRFSDGFFGLITLGIWSPRSSWYYCLEEGKKP